MASTLILDSLVASEFALEINGETLSGIFTVEGFVSYQVDAGGVRQLPPFSISKMVQHDANNAFNAWLIETTTSRHTTERPRRDVVLKAVDDGIITRSWTIKSAFILSVAYSSFDVASFAMMQEIYHIGYEDIEEVFTTQA